MDDYYFCQLAIFNQFDLCVWTADLFFFVCPSEWIKHVHERTERYRWLLGEFLGLDYFLWITSDTAWGSQLELCLGKVLLKISRGVAWAPFNTFLMFWRRWVMRRRNLSHHHNSSACLHNGRPTRVGELCPFGGRGTEAVIFHLRCV